MTESTPRVLALAPTSHACTRCDGAGERPSILYPEKMQRCLSCHGVGAFSPIDESEVKAFLSLLISSRGKNKGSLRASWSWKRQPEDDLGRKRFERAYYVWRIARFHGGVDMTLPMMAQMYADGDPCIEQLEALADLVAQAYLGSNMRAAQRWGRALGYL